MSQALNYEELVKSYYDNLYNTLRNFRPGPEFLEDWVHDEDHTRSLLGIFEAAHNHGLKSLSVNLSTEISPTLNQDWLLENLKSLGSLSINTAPTGLQLIMQFSQHKLIHHIHPAYQKELSDAAHDLRHQGALQPAAGVFHANHECGSLSCTILEGLDGRVLEAKHSGAQAAFLPLLDRFCDVLIGCPIQEGAEHGTLALERMLRNPYVPPPVQGLITPLNADPIFTVPQSLARDIYLQWRNAEGIQGIDEAWNDFERPCSERWLKMTTETRLKDIADLIPLIVRDLKIPYEGLEALAIKGDSRIIFARNDFSKLPRSGQDLLVIECELKRRLEPRLEIVLESLDDKNHREGRTHRELMKS